MFKKNNLKIKTVLAGTAMLFLLATPVFAEQSVNGEEPAGIDLFFELATLVIVGGIIYNIWVTVSGFGGLIGKALKFVATGLIFLSINTLDEVIEHLSGVGSETIFGTGLAHEIFHQITPLTGFIVLAAGLSMLSKIVKKLKD